MPGMLRRTMVYLGLVDDEYDDYEPYEEPQPVPSQQGAVRSYPAPERQHSPERQQVEQRPQVSVSPVSAPQPNIRTIPREPAPVEQPQQAVMARPSAVVRPIAPRQSAKVHVVTPTRFPDAQEIGDLLRASQAVIVNLQGADRELGRRMIDFCSGVTYALAGSMEKAADQVFLLTPSNVEVSVEEKRRLSESGLYDG
ncbi:MAG TPA: cell division protein SepF [Acidimicrobiales bacterium]|nr:cell division protein SepF [Acidimicrobiales bacterium]